MRVDGKWVQAGLGVGTPDLVGFVSVTITPEMVGKKFARVVGIEVKKPGTGRASPEQLMCISMWQNHGAVALITDNLDEAVKALDEARNAG